MATSPTDRQYIALRFYYVEGWSITKIADALSCTKQAVHGLIRRGKLTLTETYRPNDVDLAIHVRELLRPSPVASVTRDLGEAARRQETLLDELEQRVLQRDSELADIEDCMSGKVILPLKRKRNRFDQWEVRYLDENKVLVDPIQDEDLPAGFHMEPRRKSYVPESAYRAKNAAKYCAGPADCTLGCYNCHGKDA